jgi:hypothetical protein
MTNRGVELSQRAAPTRHSGESRNPFSRYQEMDPGFRRGDVRACG